ncbi:MAG: hypothetical protein R3E84_11470 [Pseudomonadales bacterium]
MTITIDQDVELLSAVQAGMQSRGFDSLWLSDEDARTALPCAMGRVYGRPVAAVSIQVER